MATVIINSDKTISINGKKIFPVAMSGMCNPVFDAGVCDLSKNSEFYISDSMFSDEYLTTFEQNKVFFVLNGQNINNIPQSSLNSPYFLYYETINEPQTAAQETIASAVYKNVKSKDTNHPIMMGQWKDMLKWSKYTDIIANAIYPIRANEYAREDSMYAYEHLSWTAFFDYVELNSPSMTGKPVWAYILGNGVQDNWNLVPYPYEVRANTYIAITMDVKGILFYGYNIFGAQNQNTGLSNNPELHAYYRQLGKELIQLNDVLVLPTKDYSWEFRKGTNVTFSKTLTKNLLWRTYTNFNYILKQSGNEYYLIIVNKDSRPISGVDITIKGLTGSMTAKTLGLETSGSGRAGRAFNVNNGQFTDSFDGLAVHIYQISSDIITCPASECNFTITQ